MKNTFILFTILISLNLNAQINNKYEKAIPNTNLILGHKIIELVNLAIQDSLYESFPYLINHYGSPIDIKDSVIVYEGKRKRKKEVLRYRVYFNPFSKIDSAFVYKQQIDTVTNLNIDSIEGKILIDDSEKSNRNVLFIEKPIFSKDLKQAYIKTCITYNTEIACYETYYVNINGVWTKTKQKSWIRS